MKFRQMPPLLLPMSQIYGEIVEIFVFDHTYDTILVRSMVNEGFYDENDKISIMAKVFANTLAHFEAFFFFGNFPNIVTCISQY